MILAVLVAAACAAPAGSVLEHTEVRDDAGQYSYRYLTSDGSAATQQGALVQNDAGDGNVLEIRVTTNRLFTLRMLLTLYRLNF